ncbi:MAG: asparagine synthase (glutamine-hydrolyzing) [Vicinamibacterales bacterium]
MCGIAGFADATGARGLTRDDAAGRVHEMCAHIRHRGPDDEGIWVGEQVALGMRRLSIIDVAGGHQPIHNEDRTVWTVFNGEIYNFRDLRAELEAAGHVFTTSTDTEVIVHAWEEWRTGAVARLRGMFGLAIWDTKSRTLVLARDRIGIKPLYYTEAAGRLYFASELKSLRAAPDVPLDLDVDALDHFLSFLYTPRDSSIFRNVRKLPPGHMLTWEDGHLEVAPYWQPAAVEAFSGSDEEAEAGLQHVLLESVGLHMVSDVPVGAFLSGGVDSSLVVALMARLSPTPVKTFSIGFDEPAFDELPHARRVADYYGTDHHEVVVRPDAVQILERLVWHFDEPFADASAIPTWYVSEVARRHVTVVLSGDGGDELFGGYDRYVPHTRVAAFDRLAPRALRRLATAFAASLPHGTRGKNFLRHVGRDERGRYLDAIRYFSDDEKPALLSADVQRALTGPPVEARLARHFQRYRQLSWPSQMMRFDLETYLPEDVLTKVDRMSMAHSIESRVPLLDNAVVDYATSLPASFKIRNNRRKHVLKAVASRLLPHGLVDRPKQGFGVPLGLWFRGGLRELFADVLLGPTARQQEYFEPRFVSRLVDEHLSGRRDHTLRLWQLVVFECWRRQQAPAGPRASGTPLASVVG